MTTLHAVESRIPFAATDPQWDFLEATEPNVHGAGGYGAGKSVLLRYSIYQQSLANPGLTGMLVADTFGRLYRDVTPKLKELFESAGIEVVPIPKEGGTRVPGWIVGPGVIDHKLLFGSAKQPNTLKGPNAACIHVEEATTLPRFVPGLDEPLFNVLQSRLRTTGTNVFRSTGTPESLRNWTMDPGLFYRPPVDLAARDRWSREFRVIVMPTTSNLHLPPEYVGRLAAVMTPAQIKEKIDGIPAAGGKGQAYCDFDYRRNVHTVHYSPFRGDIIVGLDFNVGLMTATLSQEHQGRLLVFDEIKIPHSNTKEIALEIRRRVQALHASLSNVRVYPDASGKSRHSVGVTDFQILRAHGLVRLVYPKKNGSVHDRLNCVNAALFHRRLIVSPKCEGLIQDFEQVAIDDHGEIVKTRMELTHLSDGVGYVIVRRMPLRADRGGILMAA